MSYKTTCDKCAAKLTDETTIWSFLFKGTMHGRCAKHLKAR